MGYSNQFFNAVNVNPESRADLRSLSEKTGIPMERLKYYNENNVLPSGKDLEAILKVCKITEIELMLNMGRLDKKLLNAIQRDSKKYQNLLSNLMLERTFKKVRPKSPFKQRLVVFIKEIV